MRTTSPRSWLGFSVAALLVACQSSDQSVRHDRAVDAACGSCSREQNGAREDAGQQRNTPDRRGSVDAGEPPKNPSDAGEKLDDASADVVVVKELPCHVRDLLAQRCWRCHGNSLRYGAPMALTSLDALAQVAPTPPHTSVAARMLERVRDPVRPMPPAPDEPLTKSELALLAAWVEGGSQPSSSRCGELPVVEEPAPSKKPSDCEQTFELRAHGGTSADDPSEFTIEAGLDDRKYQCFYFGAPYGEDAALFWYEPIIDNEPYVHHWILYATDQAVHEPGSSGICNSAEPGSHFIAGWGPGTDNVELPSDTALQLKSGSSAGLILEMHYNNASGSAQQDRSGVRFCTGRKDKRAHLAGVHTTGSEGICLEPGQMREVAGTCVPRSDLGDIHVVGLWPHMHKRGRRQTVTIKRADGRSETLHDAPFDFKHQLYHVKNDVVLRAGDSLETRCFYENDTPQRVPFGEGSDDEMCYAFLTAWPAGALTSPSLLGAPRSDLLNRCADPFSVLQSCNGALDGL